MEDKRIEDIIKRITAVEKPDKIMLFGSRARSDNGGRSDFDVALFGKINLGRVMSNLEEARTLLKIDVVSFDDISDEGFKQKILDEGKIIYERKI